MALGVVMERLDGAAIISRAIPEREGNTPKVNVPLCEKKLDSPLSVCKLAFRPGPSRIRKINMWQWGCVYCPFYDYEGPCNTELS